MLVAIEMCGLDRPQRQALLVQAREHWVDATLIFISHDVAETQAFERVLLMDQGRIVEDAPPAQLLAQALRYRALLEAEISVREQLWADAEWRRLWLEDGELKERSRTEAVRITGIELDSRAVMTCWFMFRPASNRRRRLYPLPVCSRNRRASFWHRNRAACRPIRSAAQTRCRGRR